MVFYSIKLRVSFLGTRFSTIEVTYDGFNAASSIRLFLHALAGCCLVGLPHPTGVNTRYHLSGEIIGVTHIDGTRFLFTPRLGPSACDIEKGCSLGAQVYRRTMRYVVNGCVVDGWESQWVTLMSNDNVVLTRWQVILQALSLSHSPSFQSISVVLFVLFRIFDELFGGSYTRALYACGTG